MSSAVRFTSLIVAGVAPTATKALPVTCPVTIGVEPRILRLPFTSTAKEIVSEGPAPSVATHHVT